MSWSRWLVPSLLPSVKMPQQPQGRKSGGLEGPTETDGTPRHGVCLNFRRGLKTKLSLPGMEAITSNWLTHSCGVTSPKPGVFLNIKCFQARPRKKLQSIFPHVHLSLILFWDRVSCSPSYPQTCYVTKNNLELLIGPLCNQPACQERGSLKRPFAPPFSYQTGEAGNPKKL